MQPLVSVVVLGFNHEKFIERALRSVLFQTYSNFEIVFIDNHSSDRTFEVGSRILKQSKSKCTFERMPLNLGIAGGFNFAIRKYAVGDYIATLAGDDWWDMDNLKFKIQHAIEHPECGMIYGNGYNYNNETEEISIFYKAPSISGWILRDLLKAPNINPQGILYKHSLIKSLGYFDESAKVEDRDLWYRIAEKAPIGYVHRSLTFYRVNHSGNISRNIEYMKAGNEYFFKKFEAKFPKEIKLARTRQFQYFAYHLAENQPSIASLKYLFRNYRLDWLYNKQIVKCIINILKKRF